MNTKIEWMDYLYELEMKQKKAYTILNLLGNQYFSGEKPAVSEAAALEEYLQCQIFVHIALDYLQSAKQATEKMIQAAES